MAAGVFESLYNAYAGTLASVTSTYVGQWTPIATTAFAASGALYFILLGFLVFRGAVARPLAEVAVSATKFALMIACLVSLGFVGQAVTTLNQLGPSLAGASTGSNVGQAMDEYFAGVWKIQKAMELRESQRAANASASGQDQGVVASVVTSLTGVDIDQAIEKIEDFLALIMAVVCAGISAAVGFCVLFFAQIALDIVLCFTPIAIACVFWPQTRWFFQGWLSQAINYVILYIVLIIMTKMIVDANIATVNMFLGTSADLVAASASSPGLIATEFLTEAIEIMLVYLVGTFLFFQAPAIASGLAGGAASGGHTFMALAANQVMNRAGGRMGGAGRAAAAASRGGSISRG
ncbi:MAG: type IV secretion system protein [Novosphingobium sp.]